MELTLKLPDEMVSRLRPHEGRLGKILQLGLEALETAAPTPEELLEYAEGRMDDHARKQLMERLALHAEAVDDLLDYHQFEELEPPSPEHELSDHDVGEALSSFKERVGVEEDSGEVTGQEPVAPVVEIRPKESKRSYWYRPVLAMAASLLLMVGALWILRPAGKTIALVHGTKVELNNARGGRTFPLPHATENVVLVLPTAALPTGHPGRLRISASTGQVVYEREMLGARDDVFLILPGEKLPAGSYRMELFDSATGTRVHDLEFKIEVPSGL